MPLTFPVIRMRWRHLLFVHWPVAPGALRRLIPDELEIDTFDGRAWVGLVPFTMEDFSLRVLPRLPLHSVTDFHECNVRTYVHPRGMKADANARGVWFFSLDAASRLAVWGAQRFFSLPYFNARIHLHREGDVIEYGVARIAGGPPARLCCRWRAGDPLPQSKPGELAHFLSERYCLYVMKGGRLHRGRISHEPWPLRGAELLSLDESLVQAAGIMIDRDIEPVLHYADALDVRAWWLERV